MFNWFLFCGLISFYYLPRAIFSSTSNIIWFTWNRLEGKKKYVVKHRKCQWIVQEILTAYFIVQFLLLRIHTDINPTAYRCSTHQRLCVWIDAFRLNIEIFIKHSFPIDGLSAVSTFFIVWIREKGKKKHFSIWNRISCQLKLHPMSMLRKEVDLMYISISFRLS